MFHYLIKVFKNYNFDLCIFKEREIAEVPVSQPHYKECTLLSAFGVFAHCTHWFHVFSFWIDNPFVIFQSFKFTLACHTKRLNCFPVLVDIVSNGLLGLFTPSAHIQTDRSTFPEVGVYLEILLYLGFTRSFHSQ